MSDYTTQIRWLRSSGFDFGLSDYPIYDVNYRALLNQKILEHYEFREIGFETASLFKFYLNRTMREIMPKYNKMYRLLLDENDLFINTDLVEEYDRKNKGESITMVDGETETDSLENKEQLINDEFISNSKLVGSDTPQAFLNSDEINANRYATKAELSSTENLSENLSNAKNILDSNTSFKNNAENIMENEENYIRTLKGKNGGMYNYQMIYDLKNKLIDIDMMVIDDLSNLFMLIF